MGKNHLMLSDAFGLLDLMVIIVCVLMCGVTIGLVLRDEKLHKNQFGETSSRCITVLLL